MDKEDVENVFKLVCSRLDVDYKTLIQKNNRPKYANARAIGTKICIDRMNVKHQYAGMVGWTLISKVLKKDHSSVMGMWRRAKTFMDFKWFKEQYEYCLDEPNRPKRIKRDEFLVDA